MWPGQLTRRVARGVWLSHVVVDLIMALWSWVGLPVLLPFAVPASDSILGLAEQFLWLGWPGFWAGLSTGPGLSDGDQGRDHGLETDASQFSQCSLEAWAGGLLVHLPSSSASKFPDQPGVGGRWREGAKPLTGEFGREVSGGVRRPSMDPCHPASQSHCSRACQL